ncbi:MAG: J domain-containing protein [Oscillospiraceae bacterium]
MMKYFNNCKSIEDVKKLYKKLCKQYHPDLNKDDTTEIMKQINAEYETAFERFKNIHESADDNTKTYTASKETSETAAEFMVIINKLVTCEGLEIDLCGRWIWATGTTFPHKDILKGLGFRFASKKKCWYWHKDEDACRSRKNMSLDEIKEKYGCETFKGVSAPRLVTA